MHADNRPAVLRELLTAYDAYKALAVGLDWIPVRTEHADWYRRYPVGMILDVLHFPEGYLESSFAAAFVRGMLCRMAVGEEWEEDFWNVSSAERQGYLDASAEQSSDLYRAYAQFRELRLTPVPAEALLRKMQRHADAEGIPEAEFLHYAPIVRNSRCIELGGDYALDHTVLAVNGDTMLFAEYGIWD